MSDGEYHMACVTDDTEDHRYGDLAVHVGPPGDNCDRCVIVRGYPVDIEGVGGFDD